MKQNTMGTGRYLRNSIPKFCSRLLSLKEGDTICTGRSVTNYINDCNSDLSDYSPNPLQTTKRIKTLNRIAQN